MPGASEPAVATDEIVFELEEFERSDGRLRLTGRWFGVRGRRFVRPMLTLEIDGDRIRALADLEDKPWPAEDGEPWTASFPYRRPGRVAESELSVAPDITIQLPSPSAKRGRSRRLAAIPRRDAMTASWGELAAVIEAPAREEEPAEAAGEAVESAPPETVPPPPEPDPAVLQAELEQLQTQLAEVTSAATVANRELESMRAELQDSGRRSDEDDARLESLQAELAGARAAREAALRSAAQAEAEREATLARATQAEAERDALAGEKAGLATSLEQTQSMLDRLTRERDDAVTSRGAALVMRGATQALPAYERHVGWVRRGLVVIVLLGAVLAALIVLGVL